MTEKNSVEVGAGLRVAGLGLTAISGLLMYEVYENINNLPMSLMFGLGGIYGIAEGVGLAFGVDHYVERKIGLGLRYISNKRRDLITKLR